MNEQQVFWIWKPFLRKGKGKKLISTNTFFHMSYKFWRLIHDIPYSDFTRAFYKGKDDELIILSSSEGKKCLWVICTQSNQPKVAQTRQWNNPNTYKGSTRENHFNLQPEAGKLVF